MFVIFQPVTRHCAPHEQTCAISLMRGKAISFLGKEIASPAARYFNSILMLAGSQRRQRGLNFTISIKARTIKVFDFAISTKARFVIDQPLAVIARRLRKLVLST